ncbi:hypothetical protein C2I06_22505 [Niallia circulans]|uniref:TOTE conflict system archaeo-eukaryotic primase domain-containing protein n=1 Tax=Niallia circulans TaxID=1397 RepID=UPI000F459A7D|nr:hypothetical protein [Niallia circulans]AYV69394.1 hypothetical protein C2I06_22505 [Niallia circulans]
MRKLHQHDIGTIIEKMNEILIRTREPFIEQYQTKDGFVGWVQKKHKITDNIIRSHITGKRTIGIYYAGNSTIFLVFDIDVEGDAQGQKYRVLAIVSELEKAGLNRRDIHIMFSGSKGYHVQIFFDKPLPIKRVAFFGRIILGNLGELGNGIELRPENINGRAVKLPLAFHKKTKQFSYYMKQDKFEPVVDSFNYFKQIVPTNYKIIEKAIDIVFDNNRQGKNDSRHTEKVILQKENDNKVKKSFIEMKLYFDDSQGLKKISEQYLTEGLRKKGERHKAQFLLALYFKEQSVSREEAIQHICSWVKRQKENKKTNEISLEFLRKEVERHVNYVYAKGKYQGLYTRRGRQLVISMRDINFIAKQERKTTRKVMLAIILIGKIYHDEGVFSAGMNSIGELAGVSRQTVSNVIKELISQGVILPVSEYKYTERLARTYYMLYLKKTVKNERGIISLKGLTLSSAYKELFKIVEKNINGNITP